MSFFDKFRNGLWSQNKRIEGPPVLVKNQIKLSKSERASVLKGLPPMAHGILDSMVQNGLGQAIGYPGSGPFGNFPLGNGAQNPWAPQISQTNTLWLNLRWYLISNMRQLLCQAFVEIGLVQTVCKVPVDDALAGGVVLKSKQLDEEEIQHLQISLDRDNDIITTGIGEIWNRLFGGAGILIMTDQDPEKPLDISKITRDTPLEFRAVDMWELFWDQQNTEGYDPELQTLDFEWYNYYALKLHKSRVMRLKGMLAPSFIRPRLRGWGFSAVEALIRSMNQYLKETDIIFEVLDEFKVDVYKMNNLTNLLFSADGQSKVTQRIQMANWQKNYQNALIMDKEDDWDHKQLTFAGLAEIRREGRIQVASDMRIPPIKLFGSLATGGLGKDDQAEMEVYNTMVESEVRNKLKYVILRIAEIKCQKLFNFIPDDLELEFQPLRKLGAVEEEQVQSSRTTRLLASADKLSPEEFRDICNKWKLWPVKLDTDMASLNPDSTDTADDEGQDPKKETDQDDPGANRIDTRRPHAITGQPQPTTKKQNRIGYDSKKTTFYINSLFDKEDWKDAKAPFRSPLDKDLPDESSTEEEGDVE